jgi:hypothetical protein
MQQSNVNSLIAIDNVSQNKIIEHTEVLCKNFGKNLARLVHV